MTHTPGPWTVGPRRQTMGNFEQRQVKANGTGAICEIYPHRPASYKAKNNRTVKCMVLSEADEANARLIAAAPALLEACEYVVEQSALLRSDFSWIEKCRAAIAQAKGETNG